MSLRSSKRILSHLTLGLASLMWAACGDDSGGGDGDENGAEASSEGGDIAPCELVTEEDVAGINASLMFKPFGNDSCDYVDEDADIILIVQHIGGLTVQSWADVTAGEEEPVDGIEGALLNDQKSENKRKVSIALDASVGMIQILVEVRTRVKEDALEIALKAAKIAASRL